MVSVKTDKSKFYESVPLKHFFFINILSFIVTHLIGIKIREKLFPALTDTPLKKNFATRLAWRLGTISLHATFQHYEHFLHFLILNFY